MAIFTALAVGAFLGIESTFIAGAIAFGLNAAVGIAASLGLGLVQKALSNQPEAAKANGFSAQGKLQAAGDVPRSFQLGYSVTAGSLAYANAWGNSGETPNAYFTQVITLQDLPRGSLSEVWINGELCPLGAVADASKGYPVPKYNKGGVDHLWVKYYDGTQTTADAFLVGSVSSAAHPYQSTRVGQGIAYVICTSLVEDTLFTGFPTFKFAVSGIPLYDISKDSTAGGSGSHRWSDPTTWGGDGDNLPAVQIYNLLRGIYYNGQWLYGLQAMSAARLPADNWIAQIAKCRATIVGEGGLEPTYRSGLQVTVDAQIANAVEALLTACQGRLSEIGGFYKIHLGTPDSSSFSFTDADILSTEEQSFKPFFALADSINGIAAKYPLPLEGWNTKVAPPIYRSDLETLDGGRRLLANPSFDAVPYSAQVQRLMSSALLEAQRARTHVLVLPPSAWVLEPGDIVAWSSDRNGYVGKLFRVDGVVDRANLDVGVSITEVDPSDYSWNHSANFVPVAIGPTVFSRPAPQAILAFSAVGDVIKDADGLSRRPAIRLSWDGALPGIVGVQWEVRLASDLSNVTRDRTDQMAAGAILITQSLLPNTVYGVRAAYIPSSPRDMLWSDWLTATTPNIEIGLVEFDAALTRQVTSAIDGLQDAKNTAEQIIASLGSNDVARNFLDARNVRQELSDQFVITNTAVTQTTNVANTATQALADYKVTVTAQFGTVTAGILTEQQARADAVSAVAATVTSLTATVGNNTAAISSEQTARANADGALSSRLDSTNAAVSGNAASINQEVLARANGDTALASQISSLTTTVNGNVAAITNETTARSNADSAIAANVSTLQTQVGSNTAAISNESVARSNADGSLAAQISSVSSQTSANSASISTVQTSVNGISVQYGVTGTIDGVIGGFVFSGVRSLDGSVSYGMFIRGNLLVDGTISGSKIAAGAITAINLAAGAITANSIAAGSINTEQLAVNGVTIDKIVAGAATLRSTKYFDANSASGSLIGDNRVIIKSGKATCTMSGSFSATTSGVIGLVVDGSTVMSWTFATSISGSWVWDVTGLSDAEHRFYWTCSAPGGSVGINGSGMTSVQDLRR